MFKTQIILMEETHKDAVDDVLAAIEQTASLLDGEVHVHEVWDESYSHCAVVVTSVAIARSLAVEIVTDEFGFVAAEEE
jgi:hypothetical protein